MAPHTTTLIDKEFEHIREIWQHPHDKDILTFLEKTQTSVKLRGMCNPRGPCKRSLIHYAAMRDCTELLLRLLEIGAPIDDCDQNKRTPLSWAAECGSYNATRILVENGAQVNALDDMYGTPLSWLKHAGHPDSKGLAATKAYLKENGGTMKGAKRAWILRKLGLL